MSSEPSARKHDAAELTCRGKIAALSPNATNEILENILAIEASKYYESGMDLKFEVGGADLR